MQQLLQYVGILRNTQATRSAFKRTNASKFRCSACV